MNFYNLWNKNNSFVFAKSFFKTIFLSTLLVFLNISMAFSNSLSDVDVVVQEAILHNQQLLDFIGLSLTYDQVIPTGFLDNDEPERCNIKVKGHILDSEASDAKSIGDFIVCVFEDEDYNFVAIVDEFVHKGKPDLDL